MSLLGVDDDYDSGSFSAERVTARLARVFAVIEVVFNERAAKAGFSALMCLPSCLDSSEVDNDVWRFFLRSHRHAVYDASVLRSDLVCGLRTMSRAGDGTREEAINLVGAVEFACALSEVVQVLDDLDVTRCLSRRYVNDVGFWFAEAAEGQIRSLNLQSDWQTTSLSEYWGICKRKTGALVKICSLPRLIFAYEEVCQFYNSCDPGYLQMFLDDIFDLKRDSADGIANIFHMMVLQQGKIAQLYSEEVAMNRSGLAPDNQYGGLQLLNEGFIAVKATETTVSPETTGLGCIRSALENERADKQLDTRLLIEKRIHLGSLLQTALGQSDSAKCLSVVHESGVLWKFRTLFEVDQRKVLELAPTYIRQKAVWLPFFVSVYIFAIDLRYRCFR